MQTSLFIINSITSLEPRLAPDIQSAGGYGMCFKDTFVASGSYDYTRSFVCPACSLYMDDPGRVKSECLARYIQIYTPDHNQNPIEYAISEASRICVAEWDNGLQPFKDNFANICNRNADCYLSPGGDNSCHIVRRDIIPSFSYNPPNEIICTVTVQIEAKGTSIMNCPHVTVQFYAELGEGDESSGIG